MELALFILALLGFLALAVFVRQRRLRCSADEIMQRFREHGATSKDRAKTLEEMELRSKPKYPFIVRDSQVEVLAQLLQGNIICQAGEGNAEQIKFYLDEKSIKQDISPYKVRH